MLDPTQFKSPEQWRAELNAQEYRVLREGGTEAPFVGKYTDTTTTGVYHCRACGAELFRSDEKFASHCGWPSFCANCDSHLGHVFAGEGYETPTDLRYCINSICLVLEPDPTPRP